MNGDQGTLERDFHRAVDQISADLIVSCGLKYSQEIGNLKEPLLRWLDFRLRYVDQKPRKIYLSRKFPKKLTADTERALQRIVRLFSEGGDVNPYQSKGLIFYNDTSGAKRQSRTDLLWADWAILHFHLTPYDVAPGQYFSDRAEWLLFCIVGDDFVCLIDIYHHDDDNVFSNKGLVQTVARSWPELMEPYRLKGALALSSTPTDEEIAVLRKGGVSSFIQIDGMVYVGPGLGVTSASTPTRVSMAMMNVRRHTTDLAQLVSDPQGQFRTESRKSGINEPVFKLCVTSQGLAVLEEKANRAFVLPRQKDGEPSAFMTELHDLLLPSWVILDKT
jgi:hypothetical protein